MSVAAKPRPLAFIYDRHATPTRALMLLRLAACREYAETKSWDVAGEWVDEGDAALSDDSRRDFDRMVWALAGARESTRTVVVVIFDWDRLSRDTLIRMRFAHQVNCAGGWIETIAGETTGPKDQRRSLLTAAPEVGA